ncbi:hypothetical protein H312_01019 [Anncaliia algerae PRA339]|uniref:Uncharacterized protein n=1 Tax=Anncaliia algerae PRA339 TaxID=1288291 RepID=A0A059F3Q6_9MICR|nr:hypothetical protein H312_01019 [Anncaliia algerae PRA339]
MNSDEEDVKIVEYINNTFANSSLRDIDNVLSIIQRKILELRKDSGLLIKDHFTKFIECNSTLQGIQNDLKFKPNTNEFIKKEYAVIQDLSKGFIKGRIISEEKVNVSEIKRSLQTNYNNLNKFVKIYKNIQNKEEFKEEKKVFIEFLMKKIDLEKETDEIIKLFDYYFIIEDKEVNRSLIDNTVLVSFKQQIDSIRLHGLDFLVFYDELSNVTFSFIRLLKNEQIKFEAVKYLFNKIEENIKSIKLKRKLMIDKKECMCFNLEVFKLCEENKIKILKGINSNDLIINTKIFFRKMHELKELLVKEVDTESMRYISTKVEDYKSIFCSLIFSLLSFEENEKTFRELKLIFDDSNCCRENVMNYLREYFYIKYECNILRYENLRKNIYKLNRGKEFDFIIKHLLLLVDLNQLNVYLSDILNEITNQLKSKLNEAKRDDSSLLILVNRIILLAPYAFAEIIKNCKDAFVNNRIVCYFLQKILDLRITLDGEENKIMKKYVSVYGFLLDQHNK